MFKPGSIRKIQVKNFVTYSYTEFHPGPNLNMIIGPNGTGKSTMVAAIILGLGGNPKVVGRGSKISEYVKHTCTEASINILLQSKGKKEYIQITREFDTQERTTWKINQRKVPLKNVLDCIKEFNIQVDNLCQFLPQDKVQDFAKLNKKDLLRQTQIALCRHDLVEKQDTLIECRQRHQQVVSAINKTSQKLQDAHDANVRLEGKVTNFNKRLKFLNRIEHIDRKVSWILYEGLYEKLNIKKDDKIKATQIYEKYKNAIRPIEREIATLNKRTNELKSMESNIKNAIKNAENAIRHQLEIQEAKQRSVRSITDQMDLAIAKIEQKQKEIETASAKVEEMMKIHEELVKKCGNEAEVKAKTQQISSEMQRLTRALLNLKDKQAQVDEQKQSHTAELRALQADMQRQENVKQQRLENLRRTDQDAYKAVLWLRENKHLFKTEIYEPMMIELNVLEAKNAIYVESVIPKRDRVAFICTNKEDMNLLIYYLREQQQLRVNVLHSGNDSPSLESYQPTIPIEQLRRYGCYTYLKSLFTAPAPIMKYLCRNYRVHNIPVGDENTSQCFDQIPKEIRVFFTDKYRFNVSFSKYSHQKTVRQIGISSDGGFSLSLDVLRLEQLRGRMADIRKKCDNYEKLVQGYELEVNKINATVLSLQEELTQIRSENQRIEAIAGRIKAMQQRIDGMRQSEDNRDNIRVSADKKIQTVLMEAEALQKDLVKAYKRYYELLPKLPLNTMKIDIVKRKINHLENQIVENRQSCQEAEEMLNRIKEEYAALLAQAKAALTKAKSLSKGFTPDDEGFSEFKEEYDKLSVDLQILKSEKDQLTSQIDCLNTADEIEMNEYNNRLQQIETMQNDLEENNTNLNKIEGQMKKLKKEWLTPLSELVAQISYNFSSSFERMRCAGEISIDTGDNENDFSEYGLSIKVTYRSGEPLQQLNSTVQSGGERAVATAIFMLSLQELTPVPFRCVDEINQGMDANNERRIFEFLVECTTRPDASQYFLVTPKLVPNLKYVRGMMIHIVHNGPFVTPDRKWSVSKLCNPQGVQITSK